MHNLVSEDICKQDASFHVFIRSGMQLRNLRELDLFPQKKGEMTIKLSRHTVLRSNFQNNPALENKLSVFREIDQNQYLKLNRCLAEMFLQDLC